MRPLIATALDETEKLCARGNIPTLIVEAPTGYGKTIGGPYFFKTLSEYGLSTSFLHTFPLRAIVRDFYACTLIASLVRFEELEKLCKHKSDPSNAILSEIRSVLTSMGLQPHDIAYQMGEYLEELKGVARKEALFDARYVVTTIDSFLYNLFRIPVLEIFKAKKHYTIPRLRIFLSAVYFDEAHMVFEESEDSSTILTSSLEAFKVLQVMRVPLIVTSATMSRKVVELLREVLPNALFIRLSNRDRRNGRLVEVRDGDFEGTITSIAWKTEVLSDGSVVAKAQEFVDNGLRVFIACDTISKALKRYDEVARKVGRDKTVLLHGLLNRGDREEAMEKIGEARVLVATSVVEAGVDMSFDVLITDGGRPTSLVQRAGRVHRRPERHKDREARIFLVKEESNERVLDFIEKAKVQCREICWRLPYDYDDSQHKYIGYGKLLEVMELPSIDWRLQRGLEALSYPLFISSDTIDLILSKIGHTLTRTFLIEAYVGNMDELKCSSYDDLRRRSLPLSLRHLERALMIGCVKGIVVAYGDYDVGVESVEKVLDESNLVDEVLRNNRKERFVRRYVKCLRRLYRERRNILFVGTLIDEKFYESGRGLMIYGG